MFQEPRNLGLIFRRITLFPEFLAETYWVFDSVATFREIHHPFLDVRQGNAFDGGLPQHLLDEEVFCFS